MSTKVHPASTDTLSQIINMLTAIKPSEYELFKSRLLENEAALRTLKGAGFAPLDSLQQQYSAQLPPELLGFITLKDMTVVAPALKKPSFLAAQNAVQDSPDDESALAELQREVKSVQAAYKVAIDAKVQENFIRFTCRRVIKAGNEDFKEVYDTVWRRIPKHEKTGVDTYKLAVKRLVVPIEVAQHQTTKDSSTLYQHAAAAKPLYDAFVSNLAGNTPLLQVFIPEKLKNMGRIIEKSLLKRKDDPGNANKVCDIVRGMVTCSGMQQIAKLIGLLSEQEEIVITRVKDRFLACPSAGGWRDCMINFYFKSDANRHICEIQLVHQQMLVARHGLPGHDVYNCVRNADELVNQWMDMERPSSAEEMLRWLSDWLDDADEAVHGSYDVWNVSSKESDTLSKLVKCHGERNAKGILALLGEKSMHSVCKSGSSGAMQLLLACGVDPNLKNKHGLTLLSHASSLDHVDVLNVLLSNKDVNVDKGDKSGATAFFIACQKGHMNALKAMLSSDFIDFNKANKKGFTPLYIACKEGHLDIVKELLSTEEIDINQASLDGRTPLCGASQWGRLDVVETLLSIDGVKWKHSYKSKCRALWIACGRGHLDVVNAILRMTEININQPHEKFGTPMEIAIAEGHAHIVNALLSRDGITNHIFENGKTGLLVASEKGQLDIVNAFLSRDSVKINQADKEGCTALYAACFHGHLDVVNALLSIHGIEKNQSQTDGATPLYIACQEGHLDIVGALLSSTGVELDRKAANGFTPLRLTSHLAQLDAASGKKVTHSSIVQLLEEAGAKS